jgi:hypothetical protein
VYQLAGSVNTNIVGNAAAQIPIVSPVDPYWFLNILGTSVDTGPNPFPTIPSSFPANSFFYPGLHRSYMVYGGYQETPSHRQIQFATTDIPSIQLSIRAAISPDVLARWQLANSQIADPRTYVGG